VAVTFIFCGATLGSALSLLVPYLDCSWYGFVAVFSGATTRHCLHSYGLELFGLESGLYIAIACFIAYLVSGPMGIYQSNCKRTKHLLYQNLKFEN
jgi:H+/Cl- antiporter ClcA